MNRTTRQSLRRFALLLACLTIGGLVGWGVAWFSGSAMGYLAIPLAVAVGWWSVADPTQCG